MVPGRKILLHKARREATKVVWWRWGLVEGGRLLVWREGPSEMWRSLKMHSNNDVIKVIPSKTQFSFCSGRTETKPLSYVPACVEEMPAPAGPREAAQAGSPREAAAQTTRALPRMGGRGRTHLGHSRGLPPWEGLRSSSPGLSGHSTFPRDCSREGRGGGAGSDRRTAEEEEKA